MDDIAKSCVYCGRIAAKPTRDHIPPKSLFNKPRPANLITVCACGCCNERFRKDEDYFWLTLSSRSEAARNPEAGDASFRAIQNLARPEATGFRSAFLGTVRSLAVKTASGLYVGDTLTYDVSFARLNRVAAKITRGLFCFETNRLLAANYLATARALDQFTESPEARTSNGTFNSCSHTPLRSSHTPSGGFFHIALSAFLTIPNPRSPCSTFTKRQRSSA
jgi:hypothetical protein